MTSPTTSRLSSRRNGHLVVPAYVQFDHEFHTRVANDISPIVPVAFFLGLAFCGWLLWQGLHEIARVLGIGG